MKVTCGQNQRWIVKNIWEKAKRKPTTLDNSQKTLEGNKREYYIECRRNIVKNNFYKDSQNSKTDREYTVER